MSEADELFKEAYNLHVIEEHTNEAIERCRRALMLYPDHYRARVFLGMLLGDQKENKDVAESRQHFIEAIQRTNNTAALCNSGYEESAIHQLGIWEWGQGNYYKASLFLLLDTLLCESEASHRYLSKVLDEADPGLSSELKIILDRIRGEHQKKP
jgi:tetratricopeptide (TPR) repeat protein